MTSWFEASPAAQFLPVMLNDSMPDAVLTRAVATFARMNEFEWELGVTPFSHPSWPIAAIMTYAATIYCLHNWMKNRERFKLVKLTRYHNLFLCLWSLVMCLGAGFEVAMLVMRRGYGLRDLICDNVNGVVGSMMRGRLAFWGWLYYVSKYYELFDTVLLILKRKPLTALHVYHHIIIMVCTWSWNAGGFSVQWYSVVVNCAVHVVMYYYYYVITLSTHRPWWRVHITQFQLTQFVVGQGFAFAWGMFSFVNLRVEGFGLTYDDSVCSGHPWEFWLSSFMTISFIYLFGLFFYNVYIRKKDRKLAAEVEKEKKGGKKD